MVDPQTTCPDSSSQNPLRAFLPPDLGSHGLHLACPYPEAGWTSSTVLQPRLNKIIESASPCAWHVAGVQSWGLYSAQSRSRPNLSSPAYKAGSAPAPCQSGHRLTGTTCQGSPTVCRPHARHLADGPGVSRLLGTGAHLWGFLPESWA